MKIFALLVALSFSASAALEERYEDFRQRVGVTTRMKPQDSDGVMTAIHKVGEVDIMVTAVHGVIKSERHTPCSLDDAKAILAAQKVGSFGVTLSGESNTLWHTSDRQYAAIYDAKKKSFTVWNLVMNEIITKKTQRSKEGK